MPLQFRRGNTTERQLITPLIGEPVFDTSTNQLFIGDGTTAGGVPITSGGSSGATTEDIQDVAAQMLINGTHTGISFTYDDNSGVINSTTQIVLSRDLTPSLSGPLNLNNQSITGTGSVNIQGDINAINLQLVGGQLTVANDGNSQRTATLVRGSNANLGASLHLRRSKNTTELPATVATGDLLGNIVFEGYDGNSFAITSSVASRATGTIADGVVPGQLEFWTADSLGFLNRRVIIDQTGGTIFNHTITVNNLSYGDAPITIRQYHESADSNNVTFIRSRGTIAAPAAITAGDDIIDFAFIGYDGANYVSVAGLTVLTEGPVSANSIPSKISFSTHNGVELAPRLEIESNGVLAVTSPVLVSGTGSGQVDTSSVSTYLKVRINNTYYAIPAYGINP